MRDALVGSNGQSDRLCTPCGKRLHPTQTMNAAVTHSSVMLFAWRSSAAIDLLASSIQATPGSKKKPSQRGRKGALLARRTGSAVIANVIGVHVETLERSVLGQCKRDSLAAVGAETRNV